MKTTYIGKTDILSPKLGLGTNKVGGHNLFSDISDQDGYDLLRAGLDAGITFLDTAYYYGFGKSEEIIGQVLKDYDRHKIILATKGAQDKNHDFKVTNRPEFLKQAVDDSLRRLHTDYLDIFYIHYADATTPKDEAIAALADEKKAGKIRAIGVSNFSLPQIKQANVDNQVDIVEDEYNLIYKQEKKRKLPYLKAHQISFVPYWPLASGLLTGKFGPGDLKKYNQGIGGKEFGKLSPAKFQKTITALTKTNIIGKKHHLTPTQTILAYYMADPDISVVIPGARNARQAKSTAKVLKVNLTPDDYQQIKQAFSQVN